jgi:hypothetical protein
MVAKLVERDWFAAAGAFYRWEDLRDTASRWVLDGVSHKGGASLKGRLYAYGQRTVVKR